MKLSSERILTTHVGSLPRPEDLLEMLGKEDRGEPVDTIALHARTAEAVKQLVKDQVEAGIDVVGSFAFAASRAELNAAGAELPDVVPPLVEAVPPPVVLQAANASTDRPAASLVVKENCIFESLQLRMKLRCGDINTDWIATFPPPVQGGNKPLITR